MMKVYVEGRPVKLEPADLIQSGGEGMVFGRGDQAVKIYHRPLANQAAKLGHWLAAGLGNQAPPNVLGPGKLALDEGGGVVGFQMARLPAGALPFRQLANPHYIRSEGIGNPAVLPLLQAAHETLSGLHRVGIVVGDLNDHNLHYHFGGRPDFAASAAGLRVFYVDVDSYQFGGFPCPVAMQTFLDPNLYGVTAFSQRPSFSPLTDWYAFFVLLVKSLLLVHPYGGAHHSYKSLVARATHRVSILDPAVTLPKACRPPETLSDDLLHQLYLTFAKGERRPFPADLLADYANSLIRCRQCGLDYPACRVACPACRRLTPASKSAAVHNGLTSRLLLAAGGRIVALAVLPAERLAAITYSGATYSLVRAGLGGKWEETALFTGRPGYRFAFFGDYLVVNQPGSNRLAVVDAGQVAPGRLALVETATFRDRALFATTGRYLYRVAGSALLRGQVRYGHLVEEVAGTIRPDQSCFWAGDQGELLAGYYRLFDRYHFFLLNGRGESHELALPPLEPGESLLEATAVFGRDTVAILLSTAQRGRLSSRYYVADSQGRLLRQSRHEADAPPFDTLSGKGLSGLTLLHPLDNAIFKESPDGASCLPVAGLALSAADTLHLFAGGLIAQQDDRLLLVGAG
jgi:hypothetical protein